MSQNLSFHKTTVYGFIFQKFKIVRHENQAAICEYNPQLSDIPKQRF